MLSAVLFTRYYVSTPHGDYLDYRTLGLHITGLSPYYLSVIFVIIVLLVSAGYFLSVIVSAVLAHGC